MARESLKSLINRIDEVYYSLSSVGRVWLSQERPREWAVYNALTCRYARPLKRSRVHLENFLGIAEGRAWFESSRWFKQASA